MNIIRQIISAVLTGVFTLIFSFSSFQGGINRELPTTPEDFTPVLRFIASSDCHIDDNDERNEKQRFADMFKDAYSYAESCSYDKIDAIIVAGDITNNGRDEQYEIFNQIVSENIKSETQLLTCLGNHEFYAHRKYDASITYEKYMQYINEEVDIHVVINGFHFIGVSYDDNGKTYEGKLEWLEAQLDEATKDDPTKPVFVYQHPHPALTVYGSVNWGDTDIATVLRKYPQVIDFSGHSHYTASDPRSIWQGSYTAVGTASTRSVVTNTSFLDEDGDAPGETGTFWIVEVDAQGNTRLMLYDIANHCFFENNEYYLTDITNKKSHRYTWNNLKSLDTAPEFPENSEIKLTRNEDGSVTLSFPDANGYWGAENYKISVKSGAFKTIWSDTVVSNYVRAVSDGMSINLGELESGTYTVKIRAYSPYAKGGEILKAKITVE